MMIWRFVQLALLSLLILGACGKLKVTRPADIQTGRIVSINELTEFGKVLESAMQTGDTDKIRSQVDCVVFSQLIADKCAFNSDEMFEPVSTVSIVRASLTLNEAFTLPDCKVRRMKTEISGDGGRMLLRCESQDNIRYLDCVIERRKEKLKIVDIYIDLQEQPSSEIIAKALKIPNYKTNRNAQEVVNTFFSAIGTNEFDKAVAAYENFPDSLKANELLRRYHLPLVSDDRERYVAAQRDFVREFPKPGNPTVLHMTAYYFIEDYPNLLRTARSIRKRLGVEDANLDSWEALALGRTGKFDQAYKLIDSALVREPDYEMIRWTQFDLATRGNNHAVLVESLDALVPDYPALLEKMKEDDSMQDFRSSPLGQKWLEHAKSI